MFPLFNFDLITVRLGMLTSFYEMGKVERVCGVGVGGSGFGIDGYADGGCAGGGEIVWVFLGFLAFEDIGYSDIKYEFPTVFS